MTFTKVLSSRLRVDGRASWISSSSIFCQAADKGGKDQLKLTELKIRGLSAEIESNMIQQSPKS